MVSSNKEYLLEHNFDATMALIDINMLECDKEYN